MKIHWSIGLGIMALLLASIGFGVSMQDAEEEFTVGAVEEKDVIVVEKETVVYEVPDTPEEYIKWKFGEHADKAFLLLKGKGEGSCAENKTLDPHAVNDNTVWGGLGIDRGIFQINSFFNPLTEEEAFDWKINIDYAYKLFVRSGNSFELWTCGKVYGI